MFSSSIAIVIGPTPPGTGVICDARFIASENFSYPRVGNSSEKKQGECLSAKRFVLFIGGMNLRFILRRR